MVIWPVSAVAAPGLGSASGFATAAGPAGAPVSTTARVAMTEIAAVAATTSAVPASVRPMPLAETTSN